MRKDLYVCLNCGGNNLIVHHKNSNYFDKRTHYHMDCTTCGTRNVKVDREDKYPLPRLNTPSPIDKEHRR